MKAQIDRAEAKRELLVRKTELLMLEAQLHDLDVQNERMEKEYTQALAAIGLRDKIQDGAITELDGAHGN